MAADLYAGKAWVTLPECAARLGRTRQRVHSWVTAMGCPSRNVAEGGKRSSYRVRIDEVRDWAIEQGLLEPEPLFMSPASAGEDGLRSPRGGSAPAGVAADPAASGPISPATAGDKDVVDISRRLADIDACVLGLLEAVRSEAGAGGKVSAAAASKAASAIEKLSREVRQLIKTQRAELEASGSVVPAAEAAKALRTLAQAVRGHLRGARVQIADAAADAVMRTAGVAIDAAGIDRSIVRLAAIREVETALDRVMERIAESLRRGGDVSGEVVAESVGVAA